MQVLCMYIVSGGQGGGGEWCMYVYMMNTKTNVLYLVFGKIKFLRRYFFCLIIITFFIATTFFF